MAKCHEIHHGEAQAQGERAEECGGTTAGAEVPGLQLYRRERTETAHRAEGAAPVQAENTGTDATDAGHQHGTDDQELASYLRGWKGYFGFSQTPSVLRQLEAWMRRRLRSVIWKQWKRSKVRFAKLRQRNVGNDLAAQTAGSSHGPWRLANSPALSSAFPIAYFDSLGLPRLLVCFSSTELNRRMRTRMYGGVAGVSG